MIVFPETLDAASQQAGSFRAGGTDLYELRHLGVASGPIVDLRDVPDLDRVRPEADGSLRLGAKLTIGALATDPHVGGGYPGLAEAAGGLATPQIRAVATLAGNLLQRTRCWYFRNPHTRCLKKGGSHCPAREGDHLHHACFDLGPCAAVHASTLGMALLAYEARIETSRGRMTIAALYGDGTDPRRDHHLEEGALVTEVVLPPATTGERSAYFRAISRSRSEWPLVEVLARLVTRGGRIELACVTLGGVAPRPLRLPHVEAALQGEAPSPAVLEHAARVARQGAAPLPMTHYKVDLVEGAVLETLERALVREPVTVSKLPTADPTNHETEETD